MLKLFCLFLALGLASALIPRTNGHRGDYVDFGGYDSRDCDLPRQRIKVLEPKVYFQKPRIIFEEGREHGKYYEKPYYRDLDGQRCYRHRYGYEKVNYLSSREEAVDSELKRAKIKRAVAVFDKVVKGNVFFTQKKGCETVIEGVLQGLKPGKHGMHIHQYGDLTQGCASAGVHFNPFNKTHGDIHDCIRHAGDLGNIDADKAGVAKFKLTSDEVQLSGPYSVIGRAIVVHENEDDLGRGVGAKREESLKNGNSGNRIGCAVIGLMSPK